MPLYFLTRRFLQSVFLLGLAGTFFLQAHAKNHFTLPPAPPAMQTNHGPQQAVTVSTKTMQEKRFRI